MLVTPADVQAHQLPIVLDKDTTIGSGEAGGGGGLGLRRRCHSAAIAAPNAIRSRFSPRHPVPLFPTPPGAAEPGQLWTLDFGLAMGLLRLEANRTLTLRRVVVQGIPKRRTARWQSTPRAAAARRS